MPLVVGRLEAAEQLVERGQHLLGQLGRDEVLVLPALGQDGRQALLVREREEPLGGEQHLQGREDRPARHLGHGLHGEGQVARRLAPRGVDQAQVRAVGEQADRHLGLAQEPLETGLGAGLPAVVLGVGLGRVIEVEAELDPLDEHEPLAIAVRGLVELRDGVGRPERLVVLGERRLPANREQALPPPSRRGPPAPSRASAWRSAGIRGWQAEGRSRPRG